MDAKLPICDLSLRKSNAFISAKYQSSLLENKVMAIALTRIERNEDGFGQSVLEAKLYPGELKELISDEAHIYRDLKKLATLITGRTMLIEDGRGNFMSFAIVPNATYIDGVFTITFNNALKPHIFGLSGCYTTLELSMISTFLSNSSFRIYELLKKDAYKIPRGKGAYTEVEYNLAELRFMIGLANSESATAKRILSDMGRNIDWDELLERLDPRDKKYVEWRDFNRRVLIPAQEELSEKSDLRFEYYPIKDGRKTKRIRFRIFSNVPKNTKELKEASKVLRESFEKSREKTEYTEEQLELFDEFVGHNKLTVDDIDLILRKANYDAELVRAAIKLADKQSHLVNYVGWIIKCIVDDYSEIEVLEGSADKAARINKFMAEYEDEKADIAVQCWEHIKQRDEFDEFLKYAGFYTVDDLEKMFKTPAERIGLFADWKREKRIL